MAVSEGRMIEWKAGALKVIFNIGDDQVVRIKSIEQQSAPSKPGHCSSFFTDSSLPLAEVRLAGEGTCLGGKTSKSLIGSYIGQRLKYRKHEEHRVNDVATLSITTSDVESGLEVTTSLSVRGTSSTLRSEVTVRNSSEKAVNVQQVTSIVIGGLTTRSQNWWEDYTLFTATNSWFREAQWREHALPSIGVDDYGMLELPDGHTASMASFSLSNHGSFSTLGHLPIGLLKHKNDKDIWVWQVENNGSWKWEIGDFKDSVYVAACGPNDADHQWNKILQPGDSFTSVPVALSRVAGGLDAAFAELNAYRRTIRRKHADNERLSLIFNDYMNCLMGDPTEEKVAALIEPVLNAGAEYFCIDCGWYADDSSWWDDVGEWEPSKKRFPSGFKTLLDKIRTAGLVPGVWVEPEVVGVRSVVAKRLPDDCFFLRNGQRIVEKGRYQLDYSNPTVREHMDAIIDKLVLRYGVGYFKFDYNIDVTQGTDVHSPSPGDGQLEHSRAYLAWVNRLYDRHADLVIESCSSGAQRLDYAMLATHSLQSTSDQQDPIRYAAIAAAIPTAVTPEQGATWAYPQPGWDDEKNVMTVVNSLLGRIHLSGRLDLLSPTQLALVTEGMSLYKEIRSDLPTSSPFWPLGLPTWHGEWLALGLAVQDKCYVAVWRRGGTDACDLPIKPLHGHDKVQVELIYPKTFQAEAQWRCDTGSLHVRLAAKVSARLFRLSL